MNRVANLTLSVGETLVHEAGRLLFGLALGTAKQLLDTPQPLGTSQLAFPRALQRKTVDGALLAGPRTEKEYAKYTLKKGLPTEQRPRTLAVENQPHSVDDFNGVIKEGYGKGEKRLIYSGTGVIKVGGNNQLGKINVHAHDAEKAGLHYDFVAEGVDPHTESFEVNIPNGALKGSYAFRQAFEKNRYLVVRMKDNSVLVAKPDIHLKPPEFLKTVQPVRSPGQRRNGKTMAVSRTWQSTTCVLFIAAIGRKESLTTISSRPSKTSAIALPCGWPAGSSQAPSRKELCCVVSFIIRTEPPEWAES